MSDNNPPLPHSLDQPWPATLAIDIHNHVVPQTFVSAAESQPERIGARIEWAEGRRLLVHDNGLRYPVEQEFFDPGAKLLAMDKAGIDLAFLSPAPTLFYYWAFEEMALHAARTVNDGIAQMVGACPGRLRGLATLPLQHPEAAVAELDRAVLELGLVGIEVGTTVEGEQLAHPRFRPVLRRAAELGVLVFAHPLYLDPRCGFGAYYLVNLVGNPLDTTMMVAHLMFSGASDELPDLNICLAHGGGFVPYQIGRLRHGHDVRPETRVATATPPSELLKRFYFDVLLHDPKAIRYLIDQVGSDRLMLGTDAPFDMGLRHPLSMLAAVPGLTRKEHDCICCGTALSLLSSLPGSGPLPSSGKRLLGLGSTVAEGASHAG